MIAHVLFWLGIACLMAVCASAAWENLTRPRPPRGSLRRWWRRVAYCRRGKHREGVREAVDLGVPLGTTPHRLVVRCVDCSLISRDLGGVSSGSNRARSRRSA